MTKHSWDICHKPGACGQNLRAWIYYIKKVALKAQQRPAVNNVGDGMYLNHAR